MVKVTIADNEALMGLKQLLESPRVQPADLLAVAALQEKWASVTDLPASVEMEDAEGSVLTRSWRVVYDGKTAPFHGVDRVLPFDAATRTLVAAGLVVCPEQPTNQDQVVVLDGEARKVAFFIVQQFQTAGPTLFSLAEWFRALAAKRASPAAGDEGCRVAVSATALEYLRNSAMLYASGKQSWEATEVVGVAGSHARGLVSLVKCLGLDPSLVFVSPVPPAKG